VLSFGPLDAGFKGHQCTIASSKDFKISCHSLLSCIANSGTKPGSVEANEVVRDNTPASILISSGRRGVGGQDTAIGVLAQADKQSSIVTLKTSFVTVESIDDILVDDGLCPHDVTDDCFLGLTDSLDRILEGLEPQMREVRSPEE
jgi:hypothetical protein